MCLIKFGVRGNVIECNSVREANVLLMPHSVHGQGGHIIGLMDRPIDRNVVIGLILCITNGVNAIFVVEVSVCVAIVPVPLSQAATTRTAAPAMKPRRVQTWCVYMLMPHHFETEYRICAVQARASATCGAK